MKSTEFIRENDQSDSHDADPGLEYDEPEMKQLR